MIWRCVLVGAGIGLSLPALTAAGMGALAEGVKGAGAGMLNTARQLGFLLGVAVLVAVFAHTMTAAVNDAADKGQAVTRAQSGISQPVKDQIVDALDTARTIDATAGMSEIRKIAHPIADVIAPQVGFLEGIVLVQLKNELEIIFWDAVSAAFRWPFYVAAMAAAAGAVAGAFLPRRRPLSARTARAGRLPAAQPTLTARRAGRLAP